MKVSIVSMKGKQSERNPHMFYKCGQAIYVEGRGYLSVDGKTVYTPCGGRKALKSILDMGLDKGYYSYIQA